MIRQLALSLPLALALGGCAAAPTLVARDDAGGFALYRSGRLDRAAVRELCAAGVREIVALNGDAERRECRFARQLCPELRVRYNSGQDAHLPLDAGFLAGFDAWVAGARRQGRKIAFHCRHGWHRAGRLTAWYRMRFEDRGPADAIAEMLAVGRFMDRHPQLPPQVEAMADHLAGRPCSTRLEHCVRQEPATAGFADDLCPPR